MGFCTRRRYPVLRSSSHFEQMLGERRYQALQVHLESQRGAVKRLKDRKHESAKAVEEQSRSTMRRPGQWKDYSRARDEMFARTHTAFAPWTIFRARGIPGRRTSSRIFSAVSITKVGRQTVAAESEGRLRVRESYRTMDDRSMS